MKHFLVCLAVVFAVLFPTFSSAQDFHFGRVVQEDDRLMFYLNGEIPLLSFETATDEVLASPLLFIQGPKEVIKHSKNLIWIETTGMSIVDFGLLEKKLLKPMVGETSKDKVKGKILAVRNRTEFYELVIKDGKSSFLMKAPIEFDAQHLSDCVKSNRDVMVYYKLSTKEPGYFVTGYSLFKE